MRIVAGAARGRRLMAPRGSTTRPTSDRVREAVFSTLQSRLGSLERIKVLDLFAGSGAMGLEALSRGAASAVFVESNRTVARTLRDNIDRVGIPEAHVVVMEATQFALQSPDGPSIEHRLQPFDLVLCDPPYALAAHRLSQLIEALVRSGWVAADGEFVVERDARDTRAPWPEGAGVAVSEQDRRIYGDTALWYGRLDEREP